MADKSVTAGSVLAGANAHRRKGIAGATITAGQAVYEDSTDSNKFKLADANASAATANCAGIALHGASSGQPLEIDEEDDDFTPGFTLDLSVAADSGVYVLSATAGGIAPMDDLAAGMYPQVLLVAKSTSKCKLLKQARGTTVLVA